MYSYRNEASRSRTLQFGSGCHRSVQNSDMQNTLISTQACSLTLFWTSGKLVPKQVRVFSTFYSYLMGLKSSCGYISLLKVILSCFVKILDNYGLISLSGLVLVYIFTPLYQTESRAPVITKIPVLSTSTHTCTRTRSHTHTHCSHNSQIRKRTAA